MNPAPTYTRLEKLYRSFDSVVLELVRHFRWSYLPPLLVYFAAGVSGLTAIAGTFFIKEYLQLSAEFIASLGFWVGLPWVLKMPLGHLVDIIWKWKFILVYFGAFLIAVSLSIMYGLIAHTGLFTTIAPVESWYIASVLLAPIGYVVQDVVADAMTVEAVPEFDDDGARHTEDELKSMHTTMQTLGRIAIISGTIAVALLNVFVFADAQSLSVEEKADTYAFIYALALVIPAISIMGVTLGQLMNYRRAKKYRNSGMNAADVDALINPEAAETEPNYWIFAGGLLFAVVTITFGFSDITYAQEIIFVGSITIIGLLILRLMKELPASQGRALIGTAIIIFVFRAIPSPGPGVTWWEIDILGFDQQFLATLTVITAVLTLIGMILLRPLIATRSIAFVIVLLTIAGGVLSLPNIGLFYGIQNWTAALTNGVVDARFIAILDTMLESPLGQIAMIPMLAWIARNAPPNLKATFFAVMASFTNLALSASSLGTKYLNQHFTVVRDVTDPVTGAITTPADYSEVGVLLITASIIGLCLPLLAVLVIQSTRYKTSE